MSSRKIEERDGEEDSTLPSRTHISDNLYNNPIFRKAYAESISSVSSLGTQFTTSTVAASRARRTSGVINTLQRQLTEKTAGGTTPTNVVHWTPAVTPTSPESKAPARRYSAVPISTRATEPESSIASILNAQQTATSVREKPITTTRQRTPDSFPEPLSPITKYRRSFESEEAGFSSIPDQIHKKVIRKGFTFNVLVVGQSGLGKATVVNSLFLQKVYPKHDGFKSKDTKLKIVEKVSEIEENGVKLKLRVVAVPGFGDLMDNSKSSEVVRKFIEKQNEAYMEMETGIHRQTLAESDSRVHCCLYFVPSWMKRLRRIDLSFIRCVQDIVNVVLVIGKADSLYVHDVDSLKMALRDDITRYKLKVYDFVDAPTTFDDADFDSDDGTPTGSTRRRKGSSSDDTPTENDVKPITTLPRCVNCPFAVVGSDQLVEVRGRKVRGRVYPWGIVEVDNPRHSDFAKLRHLLINSHLQDLKDVTNDHLYERYRQEKIRQHKLV